ncbi:unnamed protein product [Brassicogethes aeneus]|uniref:Indole-3-acetaldehyde oxidase n=1 Tax=Brassicogethes aeneus TaxID=1431903 RepID=A0A9P0BG08_BRAAE|nr:unnamed protein product [Brassicogethes aeneus]
MCLEGGCGACVVAVQRRDPHTGRNEVFAVNSCLVSIFSCYGWNIFSVEGIGTQDKPHAIQKTLANFNGTQCGFCSPGMVMNMFALNESQDLTMKTVENSFGGNICRCTGYRSILSAFKSLCKDSSEELLGTLPDIEDLKPCKKICTKNLDQESFNVLNGSTWVKVYKFDNLLQVVKNFLSEQRKPSIKMIAGNTARGVYKNPPEVDIFIDIFNVDELVNHEVGPDQLILGANMPLTKTMDLFYELSEKNAKFKHLKKMADHINLIANVPVRNIGTLAGNLMIKHENKHFPSDVFLIFEAIGAVFQIIDIKNREYMESPSTFLNLNMADKIFKKIIVPAYDDTFKYESYKIMPRAQNSHALVNAAFLLQLEDDYKVKSARIVYGNINANFARASETEQYIIGKVLFDNDVLQNAFKLLDREIIPEFIKGEPQPDFRKKLAISLLYKYVLSIAPSNMVTSRYLSGGTKFDRPVSTGTQDFETNKSLYPVSQSIPKIEALAQTTGEAKYIPDMPDAPDQHFACFVLAKTTPNSTIDKINPQKALKMKGVVAYFDHNDIPGRNTFTPKEAGCPGDEEELFCSSKVLHCNQPIGIIVAKTQELANEAADKVEVTYNISTVKPLTTIKDIIEADAKGKIFPDQTIERKNKGSNIKHVAKGNVCLNWQYHFQMELQCCAVIPIEDGLDMYPDSQWLDLSQAAASVALNIPMNKINVYIRRLGGAFGSKIFRAAMVSTACALAAYKIKKPVKMWLTLEQNVAIIGKRNPLWADYEIGVDENGVIQYLDNTVYYDYGCGNNEPSMYMLINILEAYYNSDTFQVNSFTTRSDMHAAAYCRSPGSAECIAMIESIMEHAAYVANIDPLELRKKNIKDQALLVFIEELREWADVDTRKETIEQYNKENLWKKKGLSVMPMVFPFHFFFNYNVMISIYHVDGTVSLAHGGVEMGQGINTKVVQVCAYKFGIPISKVQVKPTNSMTNPNNPIAGGSMTSETVCWATIKACEAMLEKLKPIREKNPHDLWEDLIKKAHLGGVELTATSLTNIHSEPSLAPYLIYGVCAAEIEIDILTGSYQILRVDLLEDAGDLISPQVDIGQIEGAYVMGLGYYLTEQLVVDENGKILSDRTWNYKPPGPKDLPINFRVKFPKNNPNKVGVLKSKATGEPPLCLAFAVPLAIRQAIASVKSEIDKTIPAWSSVDGPSTVEQVFTNCLHDFNNYKL